MAEPTTPKTALVEAKPACGAPRPFNQGPCLRPAGYGTKHYGEGRCKFHGGGPEDRPKKRPARFTPDPKGYYCDAETKTPDKHLCDKRAGMGTDHLGVGKCKFHGGATPSKSGVTSIVHKFRPRLLELIEHYQNVPDPLNILPELSWIRALAADFVERYDLLAAALLAWYESQLRGGDAERPRQVLDISDAVRILAEATKVVERIEKIRAADAISRQDLGRIWSEIAKVVTLYVTDETTLGKIKDGWAVIRS